MPSIWQSLSKASAGKAFVSRSAKFSNEGTWVRDTVLSSLRMKWCLMSIHLDFSWLTGFLQALPDAGHDEIGSRGSVERMIQSGSWKKRSVEIFGCAVAVDSDNWQ
ncbi:hypothetical protein L198_04068 [Cryptococcus wingfieldii CBS 7118]|uniref:Uncharacterized protein n=1 Tax=Cryptococcus wingfieldii CBS 7118 TaxID=1295528 RepID=A0A1E3J668_9TREE|nr:hypothetical protein L198_04068 [Cryptococcus wingfieldii CBS 7118]ODN96354.1 hypothetical protein L198_04068 [Cryptococcus wingfieldii CBS 7118]